MSHLIKGVLAISVLVIILILLFMEFGRYLVDYSLENLGLAYEATSEKFEEKDLIKRRVYESFIKDLAIDEATATETQYASVVLLGRASRLLKQGDTLAGFERARIYLTQVMGQKVEVKSYLEEIRDIFKRLYFQSQNIIKSLSSYIKSRVGIHKTWVMERAEMVLLNQAEFSEKEGKLQEAEAFYLKYLETSRETFDRGWVSLNLAYLLIQQGDLSRARTILIRTEKEFLNSEESKVAKSLRKRLERFEGYLKDIEEYETTLAQLNDNDPVAKEELQFKLAIRYFEVRRLDKAVQYFEKIQSTPNDDMRRRSQFCLLLIHKLQNELAKAEHIAERMLKDSDIGVETELALKVELADIYSSREEYEKAQTLYQEVSAQSELLGKGTVKRRLWFAMAQVERAVALTQLGKIEEAGDVFRDLKLSGFEDPIFLELRDQLQAVELTDLRSQGFLMLDNKQFSKAADLFRQYLTGHAGDPWSYAGLALCAMGYSDKVLASQYAEQAYHDQKDYFTTTVLAYIKDRTLDDGADLNEIISLYSDAISLKANYIPPLFNRIRILLIMGKYEKALEEISKLKLMAKNSANGILRAHLLNHEGIALWGLVRFDEADKAFREALELNPASIAMEDNLRLFQSQLGPSNQR